MQAMSDATLDESARVARLLGEKVRLAGYTQRTFAAAWGLSFSHTAQLLRGREPLKVKQLFAALKVLGITPAEFFSEVYPRTSRPSHAEVHLAGPAGSGKGSAMRLETLVRRVVDAAMTLLPSTGSEKSFPKV